MKKPIYKKWWFWLIAFFGVLTIYGATTGVNQAKEETSTVEVEQLEDQELEETETQEEETLEKEIELEDQLLFGEFTVNMEQVRVYEEDGEAYADVSFNWLNQAGDGKKMFMSISLLSVYQGESDLEETTGAWDVESKNTSDVYFPNAENGEINVDLTYKLENKEEPLRIVFTPLNEYNEDKQEITININ